MPQYLKIAEKIYQNVKEKKGFTDDPMEDLNNLMIELRQEIKGTKLKLLLILPKYSLNLCKSQKLNWI